ncbi:MAG: glycine rich domain-containing protein [Clostridium sp.]|nr:glycine rich domain-containing protein [Clostridium sp.]MCM1444013.1 glycine rich domain-containing protein [Candidatus Amulumruptor caecigallinarius]
MKKNEKGFILTEVLIISAIVLGVLVFMYAQFRNINVSFRQTYRYNTVEGIYKANEIKKFIESDAINSMISLLNDENKTYIDITECDVSTYNNPSFCKILYEKLGIKSVLLLNEDVTSLVNSGMDNLDNGTKNFIKYVGKNYTGNYYRIIAVFDDDTYSTVRIDILKDRYDFTYNEDMYTFVVPANGYYQIELWGASGSQDINTTARGAYTRGTIYLEKDTKLYIYVGVQGDNSIHRGEDYISNLGGYQVTNNNELIGGEETDIRLVKGNPLNFDSLKSRIMVADGGTGSSFISGYDGCDALSESSTIDNVINTGKSIHYSGYKFENAIMIAGNKEIPSYNNGFTTGNIGNGYARITVMSIEGV